MERWRGGGSLFPLFPTSTRKVHILQSNGRVATLDARMANIRMLLKEQDSPWHSMAISGDIAPLLGCYSIRSLLIAPLLRTPYIACTLHLSTQKRPQFLQLLRLLAPTCPQNRGSRGPLQGKCPSQKILSRSLCKHYTADQLLDLLRMCKRLPRQQNSCCLMSEIEGWKAA